MLADVAELGQIGALKTVAADAAHPIRLRGEGSEALTCDRITGDLGQMLLCRHREDGSGDRQGEPGDGDVGADHDAAPPSVTSDGTIAAAGAGSAARGSDKVSSPT